MGCENCGVSMRSPCAIICLPDCSVCWCSVVSSESEFSAVAEVLLKPGAVVPEITGSTAFQICTTDVPLATIAELISRLHPGASVAMAKSPPPVPAGMISGTLDELIAQLGLVSTPKGHAGA